ncbi:ABC transporter permease subunit [Microlunatus sp. Gsoil 973]|nr:ABC transporter permease subunit [Microlunatus sp. Gsoil 973]QGN34455.1 ABC transporter permease subunit [Microlunatus sp. Gsoil 973]
MARSQGASLVKHTISHVRGELLRRPLACVSIVFLVVLFLACMFAPQVAPHDPQFQDLLNVNKPPSMSHLLGTDNLGRDVLSRLLFGGRVTLLLATEAVIVFILVGIPVGVLSGYFGGRADRIIMWLCDLVLALPGLIILLVVAAVFPSRTALMVSLGFMASPSLVRVARAATLSARARLYVRAAEVMGLSRARVIGRHVLPVVAAPIFVQVTVFIAAAVVIEAAMGFLNLDVKPPAPSWGSMIADGAQVINENGWLIIPSGVAIVVTGIALGLVGDAVREISASRSTGDEDAAGPAVDSATVDTVRPLLEFSQGGDLLGPLDDSALLSVRDLSVTLTRNGRQTRLVDHVSFDIRPGQCLGIVGESGCGKTIMALAVLGLLPSDVAVAHGSITYGGTDLRAASPRQRRALRGREIAFISQEPMRALDPGTTVGGQLKEVVRRTQGVSRKAASEEAARLLAQVQLPNPEQVLRRYPHELRAEWPSEFVSRWRLPGGRGCSLPTSRQLPST